MPKARPSKKARSGREVDLSLTPAGIGKPLFSALPPELILLIISESSPDQLDRHDTLFALSRTCRHLRNITLDMTWSVFEVVRSRYPGDWSKGLADDLERKSNVLAQSTHLHPLVQYVDVSQRTAVFNTVRVILTRRRSEEVLPAFAACLFKLTSATKLVIAKAHTAMTTHLKEGFDGYTFRHIREIELPTQAHNVLRRCPEARIVIANEYTSMESSKLISAIRSACPHVEEVRHFELDLKQLKSLSKAAPNLRILGRVTLNRNESDNEAVLKQLKSFKRLTEIWSDASNLAFQQAAQKSYTVNLGNW